ncbi:ABC transporter ATP-binding protein [Dyella nitratireducens]|uniref:ABC transporter ATP-binding protein n=1 Tax=Dyella nitratireducens TaxID=1849580 RepID=A0ABQ1GA15_9GAMM|nr:ATP-binding cassette domain-containing protein [Dyella nitratireducens]GGA39658.1 ABC transporter ATP-binding protein [Dyella nitratireducens]GLQ40469.1 ABC transporter ATP-binding protein [Dyella nitratireducens]
MSGTAIQVRGLSKRFGQRTIMDQLDIDFAAGQFTVVLGPSGCGKSTLLRVIAGLEEADQGTVSIGGVDVTRTPPQSRGCAMVFQNYALYPHMSVRDNIGYALKLAGLERAERERRIGEAAELLGLRDLLERKPAQLSGGQRQRVAIGRAIARRQRVLLFDEPLSNLDAKLRHEMRMELRRLHNEIGATTIFVTHDQVEAMTLADRVVLLNQGQVEQADTPMALYHRPRSIFVAGFIGTPPMNVLTATHAGEDVAIDGGGTLRANVRTDKPTAVKIGIRPEAVELGATDGVAAKVEAVEDLGSHRVIYTRIGQQPVLAIDHGRRALIPNETVCLGFPPQAISWFHAANGERIEHTFKGRQV